MQTSNTAWSHVWVFPNPYYEALRVYNNKNRRILPTNVQCHQTNSSSLLCNSSNHRKSVMFFHFFIGPLWVIAIFYIWFSQTTINLRKRTFFSCGRCSRRGTSAIETAEFVWVGRMEVFIITIIWRTRWVHKMCEYRPVMRVSSFRINFSSSKSSTANTFCV